MSCTLLIQDKSITTKNDIISFTPFNILNADFI